MRARVELRALFAVFFLVVAACSFDGGGKAGGDPGGDPDGDDPAQIDASGDPDDPIDAPSGDGDVAPGGACSCDADCAPDDGHAGLCIYGVCMSRASDDCSAAGSTAECADGSRCWNLDGYGGSVCWPDCAAYPDCAGTCDEDGSCAPTAQMDCDPTCGAACSCTEASCGDGTSCVGGECVPDLGDGPGPGPGAACDDLPARDCTTGCGDLVTFNPRANDSWDDYPINGETAGDQYRSYLRRDLTMLVQYATAKTACKAEDWAGNDGPLGLGDMSEADGAIPGTSDDDPGHPAGTHTNGRDIDLAYYQVGTANHRLRPICEHVVGGEDQYHCTEEPHLLDVWRTAFFLGSVFESSRVRVIGVDGQAGPMILSAMAQLCDDGWLSGASCDDVALAYETTNQGYGWYYFHHHHAHISIRTQGLVEDEARRGCFTGDCGMTKSIPQRPAGLHRVRR